MFEIGKEYHYKYRSPKSYAIIYKVLYEGVEGFFTSYISDGKEFNTILKRDTFNAYEKVTHPEYTWFGLFKKPSKIHYHGREFWKGVRYTTIDGKETEATNPLIGVYKVDLNSGKIEQDLGTDLHCNKDR